jgi:radical SAM protein with 4Fe4S-binding SPASM domain
MYDHLAHRREQSDRVTEQTDLIGLIAVEINATELCNRTCSFCPRANSEVYPNRNLNMSVETAEILSAQLKSHNYGGLVTFSGQGEPTLNKDILKLISVLSNFEIELTTSADTILNGKITIQSLVENGVNSLIINDYDRNPKVQELVNVHKCVSIRDHYDDGTDRIEEYNFTNRAGMLFKTETVSTNPCYLPAYKMMLDWDGTFMLCSHDWHKKEKYGNIHTQDIADIWNSEKLKHTRRELIKGNRYLFESCKQCNIKGDLLGEKNIKYWVDNE